jgi:hypothetical protein
MAVAKQDDLAAAMYTHNLTPVCSIGALLMAQRGHKLIPIGAPQIERLRKAL